MTVGREGVDIEYEGIASGGDGGVASGYLAKPASDVGCGIVVIHDEWGLTEFIRDVCDRLARAGFVALAPDLFRGPLQKIRSPPSSFRRNSNSTAPMPTSNRPSRNSITRTRRRDRKSVHWALVWEVRSRSFCPATTVESVRSSICMEHTSRSSTNSNESQRPS
jgi:hypothetical protein